MVVDKNSDNKIVNLKPVELNYFSEIWFYIRHEFDKYGNKGVEKNSKFIYDVTILKYKHEKNMNVKVM